MFISKKVLLKVRFLTSICMALAIISSFCLTPFAFAETKPYAAQPSSSLTLPAQLFIGESFSFTASFDNTNATDTGYGPFIDLVFPRGADGDDGISFVGADYLGAPVTSITLTFPGSGCVAHPYARDTNNTPLQVCGTPGDTLVVLQLPFGSFTPDQPAADINVQATISNKADENVALPIYTRAGFQYGNDPLDNPAADPALVTNPSTSSNLWAVSTVTPDLIRLTKTYLGEEDEPVNGPNFIRRFKLSVDIAPGQTVTNLDLTDILPGTMQFVALVDTTVAGSSVSTTVLSTPSTTNPGGTLSRRFASVTGTTSSDDASMIFSFYVPRVDINTAVIIDANSGDDVTGLNNASVTAAWDPVDTRDPNTTPVINPPGPEYTLQYKSIAIQKHVVNATDPITTVNDLLLYTLDIQVSDYFAFQNIVVHDNFSDGQRFDPTFDPTLSCTEHNASTTDIFALTNYTVDISQIGNNPDLATDGSTTMVFRISDELIGRGASFADGQLVGGGIPDGGTGAGPLPNNPPMPFAGTTCQIQYRTQIQDSFSDTYPSGDQSVDQGDTMFNNVTISGDLLNVTNLTPNGQQEADLSASQIEIARGKLTKTIYAINGSTTFASPVEVQPGDTVTYRLMYELPSSDIEDLKLTDYLPLPVFKVASFSTSFDPTVSAAAPAAGSAKYGPTDTFSSLVSTPDPTLSVDAGSNSLTFSYGSYDNSQNVASVIDLLLSVTVSNDPFADGLFLTNQVRQSESSTQNVIDTRDAIIQIKLTEPVLRVLKGVVASSAATPPAVFTPTPVGPVSFNAPGTAGARFTPTINSTNLATQPINSNLSGVDAGDLVTFAIVIENTGNSSNGAYDVSIKDSIPAGFAIPAGGPNLRVVNGAGTLLSYPGVDTDLFTTGISLVDGASGAIAGYDANSGTNIVVASYDLVLQNTPTPSQTLTNTAIVANYANTEAGPNFVPGDILKDTATVTTAQPKASKSIVTTSESFSSEAGTGTNTSPRQVAIGEIVRYRLLATVPEGSSPNMILRDNLPAGLIFLDDNTATISYGADTGFSSTRPAVATLALELGTNLNSNVPVVLPDQNIGSNNSLTIDADAFNSGTDVFFKLGDIVNNDSDANDETITIEFNALVDNNATANSNDAGDIRDNTFVYLIGGATTGTLSNNMRLRIVEPALSSSKTVTPASADAGDSVTYTITLANASGVNVSTAYDVNLTDIMPAELTNIVLQTPTTAGGASGASANLVGQTITLGVADMPPGSSVTLQYTADLTTSVSSGQQLTNTASTTYTSLPGTNGTANGQPGNATGSSNTATPGTLRGERTGTNPVVAPNDLVTSANATVTVFVPAPQKTLVSTSEADTATTDVAIGEIVRYRLLVRLAEGVSPAVQLRDNLPAGLKLLQDGTVRFGFVSNGAGISSSDTAINSCADVNATPTSGTTLPCALPAANIDTSSIPIFNLGDLTNSDTDADEEYVLLEFNALVENISTNNLGTSLNNTFTVLINATERATSTGLPVIVAEPVITNLTKSVQAQSPLAVGSSVSYLLSFSNTGTAPTYNLRVTDTLDNRLALTAVTVTSQPGYASTDTSATSGNNAIITIDKLSPGDSITIKLTATLQTLPSPGTIPNQADLGYTSLPGNNGSTGNLTGSDNPGTPGTADGERTGVVGDPVNDLIDSDTENLPLGMIGDLIWFDSNANGLQDVGEIGLKNVKVTLTGPGQDGIAGNADDVSASLLTSATGAYLFQGLLPGSYTVTVDETTLPTGMLISADPDGAPLSSTFSLTLADAEERRTVDFGYTGNASLGDYVWLDQNADQLQNATEDGIAGVSVTALWAGQDGDFGTVADNVSYTTTTDVNGAYLFQNLAAGNYRVSVNTGSLPAGVTPSYDLDGIATAHTTLASVSAGTANLTADFGYTGTASVGDLVWYDLDGDGNKDANEQGLANVTVTVIWYGPDNTLGTADDSSFTTTTDANGLYKVEGLPAGRYTVTTSNLPAGALPSYDLDGTGTPNSSVVTLSANTYTDLVDFGYKGGLSIGDHLWFDKNANGADDGAANGETGLANVTITLTYYGADGVSGGGDDVSVTTQTDPNGNYSFSGLLQGNYNVTVDESSLPAGLSISADPDAGTLSSSYNLTLSADRLDVDFGYKANASIGDRVWFDQNGNGIQDAAEGGIEGVQVILLDGAGNPTGLSTLTDPNGYYACTDLAAGSYQVEFILPAQYRFSPTGQGTSATDSDANSTTGRTAITTLTQQNESVTTLDAGLYEPVGFGDQIWNDINNDGLLSAGETGVANVVIDLYRDDNGDGQPSAAEFVGTTTSDPSGLYGFSDLRPGDYIAVLPAVNFAIGGPLEGMVSSTGEYVPGGSYVATPDPDDDIDDDNNGMLLNGVILSKPFTLHSQTEPFGRDEDPNTNMTIDFGVFKPARLGSLVWEDSDKDGIRDEGEAGVANITVTLYDAQNRVIGTTRTDANGGYVFNNLPPGSYSIGFSNLPDAYVFTEQDKGNDDGLDSDVDPVSARTSAVTLAPGDNNLSINAGIYKTPPTAIVLSRFTASWADTHILVEWKTEAELNTWGYQIYGSATGKRADAELLTQQAIPGRGRGGQGASYSWVDSNVIAGTEYSYWLVELEMDGSAHEYGPARAAIQQQGLVHIHLPMIGR